MHLGDNEFRELCWTEERTLKFGVRDGSRIALFRNRRGSHQVEVARRRDAGS